MLSSLRAGQYTVYDRYSVSIKMAKSENVLCNRLHASRSYVNGLPVANSPIQKTTNFLALQEGN